jgi:ABC-type transport system substrate-binding protein
VVRYTAAASAAPAGVNWSHFMHPGYNALLERMESATDQKTAEDALRQAHEIMVDEAPWVFIVHDLNARAMSRSVRGFVQAQSWFQDLAPVTMGR